MSRLTCLSAIARIAAHLISNETGMVASKRPSRQSPGFWLLTPDPNESLIAEILPSSDRAFHQRHGDSADWRCLRF
ncbi:MAG TPA: hypothetical protein VH370_09675, partial [Humisphaera sp.]|nr:hypothetical protein [Humisphaera sp.]